MKISNSKMFENPYKSDTYGFCASHVAQAVIRLIDRQKGLAERTEESVSTGVLTTQEDPDDAQ